MIKSKKSIPVSMYNKLIIFINYKWNVINILCSYALIYIKIVWEHEEHRICQLFSSQIVERKKKPAINFDDFLKYKKKNK